MGKSRSRKKSAETKNLLKARKKNMHVLLKAAKKERKQREKAERAAYFAALQQQPTVGEISIRQDRAFDPDDWDASAEDHHLPDAGEGEQEEIHNKDESGDEDGGKRKKGKTASSRILSLPHRPQELMEAFVELTALNPAIRVQAACNMLEFLKGYEKDYNTKKEKVGFSLSLPSFLFFQNLF